MEQDHVSPLADDLKRSSEAGETPDQWWSRAHKAGHAYWLSGTPAQEVWARLDVTDMLMRQTPVLNVGVGLGGCTRALAARGCVVSVLDISQEALDRVADVATGYLAARLEALPDKTFDLALSHLVAQHMSDADLETQMRHVVRSLKFGGVFAIQYLVHEDGAETDQTDAPGLLHAVKSGSVLRTDVGLKALIARAGGRCIQILERERHEGGLIWRVAHVCRR